MRNRISREQFIKDNFVICECGYWNNKRAVDWYGDCVCCKKVLNDKAYFKYRLRTLTRSYKIYSSVR